MDPRVIHKQMETESIVQHDEIPSKTSRPNVTQRNRIQCKQELIIAWLRDFFTNPGRLETIMPILEGKSQISLRLIDWFVTNYAKKHNISYILNQRQFLVYFHYKRELKAYSKRLFDPFCRRERIMFQARGYESFVTTVGQLNFFRWALEKEIISYITENLEAIEKDMNLSMREHYGSTGSSTNSDPKSVNTAESEAAATTSTKSSSSRRKRTELSKSALKKVNLHQCDIVVSFG
jgi:hypothetical protein